MQLTPEQLGEAIPLFGALLEKAIRPLADSILNVLSNLAGANAGKTGHVSLVPVYAFVIHKLATFESAVRFVREVAKVDSAIAAQKDSVGSARRSLDEDLFGMIHRKTPPKIDPFRASTRPSWGCKPGTGPDV